MVDAWRWILLVLGAFLEAFGDGEVEQTSSGAEEEDRENEDYLEFGGLIIISPQHSYYYQEGVSITTSREIEAL